jgi:hypothetical protein
MTDQQDLSFKPHPSPAPPSGSYVQRLIISYAWIILKNLIGWVLILVAWPVGLALPGPGGIPLFIIGFALVSFPGKRKLTARVLSGKPIPRDSRPFRIGMSILIVLAPVIAIIWLNQHTAVDTWSTWRRVWVSMCAYAIVVTILLPLGLHSHRVVSALLRFMSQARRKVRPWLRRHGIDLLPPRRRRRRLWDSDTRDPDPEIIEIHERHYDRLHRIGRFVRRWGKRILAIAITAAIFVYMFRQIVEHWDTVRPELEDLSAIRFALATAMFALFLGFRALSWRRILVGFGHRIPLAPITRIWSTSELARYLPGAIWQVVGRVFLLKPYGVRGSICSTSQILELATFLLANVIVASLCLLWYLAKMNPQARVWVIVAMALVPVLGLLLHPKVFYGMANRILTRLGKPPIVARLSGFALSRLLFRLVLALLWQNAAVFILLQPVLDLKIDHWWTVAGAYSLAWVAGFLAVWAPGGLGVRELVFMAAMQVVMPEEARIDLEQSQPVLLTLALILRLWATVGELIVAILSYIADYRGALGRPDAPGRVAPESEMALQD